MSATTLVTPAPDSATVRAGAAVHGLISAASRSEAGSRQERWLAWRMDPPEAPPRVDAWVVALHPGIRRDALARALAEVVLTRVEMRCCFPDDGAGVPSPGAPVQLTERAGPRGDDWSGWLASTARETLDVTHGTLVGVWWISEGAAVHLVVAAHELVGGAAGARAILRELAVAHDSALRASEERTSRQPPWPENRWVPAEPTPEREPDPWGGSRPPSLEFPLDYSRPPQPSFRAHVTRTRMSADFVDGIRSLATSFGSAVEDVWLAAVLAWAFRLTGSEAPWLGCMAGEPALKLRPVVVDHVAAQSFRDLVAHVARQRVGHHQAPGGGRERLADRTRERVDPARPWLCDLTVECEPMQFEFRLEEHVFVARRVSRMHLESDLALTIDPAADGGVVELRGNRDVLAAETLQRWLGHLCVLLESARRSAETPIARLEILTPEEKEQVLRGWNPVPAPSCAQHKPLHRILAGVAATRADHAAVVADDLVLTYAELESRSNRLACQLISRGVRPRDRVALALPRSAEYAVAALAVLKAGAAFVPIDLEWPDDRRDFVVRDCSAALVLHRGSPPPPQEGAHRVRHEDLDALVESAGEASADLPSIDVRADDLAYVIYTSGTTGRPKGVMIDHRALATHLLSIVQVYDLQPDDCGLLFHSVAFDPAIEQLFSPLVVGGTVRIRGKGLWTGREFSEFVRKEGITAVTLPPRYWLEIMREWERDPSLSLAGQLRRVLVGGEALPIPVVELWRRLGLTSIRLLNGYGPTECTVTATVHPVARERGDAEACGRVPVGRPHGPVEAYVLDEHLQPQPIGVAGELCLAGPTLARGYLGADALTRERFVPHPFKRDQRLYRTGDRVRFLADGTIDFCGRTDRQVKVGGYRIEPGEIEAVICGLGGIEACAVVPDTGSHQETILSAYVVATPGLDAPIAGWRERVRASLPGYMVPSELFVVTSLPQTINGKLDTVALKRLGAELRAAAPSRRSSGRGGARVPAEVEGQIASRVAAAWCAVLGRDDVAPDDNFFDAGGHSLLAIALYARLEKELKARFALREWLGEPTFEALVRQVESHMVAAPAADHGSRAAWKFLFPIRATGTRPRLFLFAGGRGCDEDFVVLAGLTRELGSGQPVWGVRVGGPDRLEPWHDDAWDLAEDIAAEIREFQAEGPYLLVGECIGGLLAFEVARVLERSGANVAFVALINTVCPRPGESFRWWLRTTWLARLRQELPRLGASWKSGGWRGAVDGLASAWPRVVRPPASRRPQREDGMPDDPKDYFYGRMLLRYRPTPARLPLTMIACETFNRRPDVRRWSEYGLRGYAVVPVPGDTFSCLREHAAQTAIAVRRALPDATR